MATSRPGDHQSETREMSCLHALWSRLMPAKHDGMWKQSRPAKNRSPLCGAPRAAQGVSGFVSFSVRFQHVSGILFQVVLVPKSGTFWVGGSYRLIILICGALICKLHRSVACVKTASCRTFRPSMVSLHHRMVRRWTTMLRNLQVWFPWNHWVIDATWCYVPLTFFFDFGSTRISAPAAEAKSMKWKEVKARYDILYQDLISYIGDIWWYIEYMIRSNI